VQPSVARERGKHPKDAGVRAVRENTSATVHNRLCPSPELIKFSALNSLPIIEIFNHTGDNTSPETQPNDCPCENQTV
jgi:hypothetical protein